jgi:hypothetical protein
MQAPDTDVLAMQVDRGCKDVPAENAKMWGLPY